MLFFILCKITDYFCFILEKKYPHKLKILQLFLMLLKKGISHPDKTIQYLYVSIHVYQITEALFVPK